MPINQVIMVCLIKVILCKKLVKVDKFSHQFLVIHLDTAANRLLDEGIHMLPGLIVGHQEEPQQLLDESHVSGLLDAASELIKILNIKGYPVVIHLMHSLLNFFSLNKVLLLSS